MLSADCSLLFLHYTGFSLTQDGRSYRTLERNILGSKACGKEPHFQSQLSDVKHHMKTYQYNTE